MKRAYFGRIRTLIPATSGQHNGTSGHLIEIIKTGTLLIRLIKGGQSMRRLDMLKAREILRLKYELGLSLREIGKACNCCKTTVSEVLGRAAEANVTWPVEFSDKQLISLLYPPVENQDSPPEPDIEEIYYEMKKKNADIKNRKHRTNEINVHERLFAR